mmetsp:Transcript_1417/g.4224  ORF Transcript_1417/g.4224 Transcript_1417/m.4224 type:complete len:124 (+) Transcript_1417:1-372(+)
MIAENGGLVLLPTEYVRDFNAAHNDVVLHQFRADGWHVARLARHTRDEIVAVLADATSLLNCHLRHYSAIGVDELAAATQLSRASALMANQRLVSETITSFDGDVGAFRRVLSGHAMKLHQGS